MTAREGYRYVVRSGSNYLMRSEGEHTRAGKWTSDPDQAALFVDWTHAKHLASLTWGADVITVFPGEQKNNGERVAHSPLPRPHLQESPGGRTETTEGPHSGQVRSGRGRIGRAITSGDPTTKPSSQGQAVSLPEKVLAFLESPQGRKNTADANAAMAARFENGLCCQIIGKRMVEEAPEPTPKPDGNAP